MWVVAKSGPGWIPWMIRAPSMTAVTASPGIPNAIMVMSEPPMLAWLVRLQCELLERLYRDFDYQGRLANDAIQYPRRYPDPLDREIVALLTASLAYGRVALFGPFLPR